MATDNRRSGMRPGYGKPGSSLKRSNQARQYGSNGFSSGFNNARSLLDRAGAGRRPNTYASDMDRARMGTHQPRPVAPVVPDNTQYLKTLADFMQQARDTLQSSKQSSLSSALSGIAGREAAMKQQASTSDQNIGKGYQALSAFISGQQPVIQKNFQTGIDQTAAAAADAQKAITGGNQAAVAQQNAILQRLGIEDANKVFANTGTTNAEQTGVNVADAAARAQAARTRLAENGQTAQNFNTASGNAASLEGRGAQNKVQQQLMNYMAQLQDERTQASQQSQVTEADVVQLAQSLMDQDRQVWEGNYDRKYRVESDAQENAQRAMEAQMEAQMAASQTPELNATTYSALGPAGQATYALQQSGVDPTQSKVIANALQQAYNSGNVRSVQDFIKLVQQYSGNSDPIDVSNAASIYYNYFQ